MNMKKTFAGAMAGALAVSAMATSASAAKLAPNNSYEIDLRKDAKFTATVQFTFDNTYIVDKDIYEKSGKLALKFADSSNDFNLAGASEIKVEVEGAKGTAKQTVIYNKTWNDVNFYNWNLLDKNNTLEIPALANSNTAATMQSIYLDKFNTFNQAYATTTSAGAKIYPVVGTYDAVKGWTTTTTGDRDAKLDTTVIEKIVVTAKFPVKKSFTLDALNATYGYKNKVTASITGLTNVDVYAIDNIEYLDAAARLKVALTAQGAIAAAEAADLEAAKGLVKLNELLEKQGFKPVASATEASTAIGHSSGATNTAGIKEIQDKIAEVKLLEDAAKKLWALVPAKYVGYNSIAMVKEVEDLQTIVNAYKQALGVSTIGVQIGDKNTVTAETLFTKFESEKVGVCSGVVNDNGTIKTVSGDIGAWKPDALRQIADAIADYEGVTLTFKAAKSFDDAAYRNGWFKNVDKFGNVNWVLYGLNEPGTDNVKDSYEEWGVSMFTGAIVLNRDFSKQFSQSNLVDWGTDTITFDWDELTEGRFYDASIVLHSMEILSTQNVEWVSCTVSIPEQSDDAEVVDPSQGATDDSDVIDPTPVEDTTAPIITAAPETDAPAPVTDVPAPVTNPTTGNAPVALAVIPVALAAAAIVAKKRG